MKYQRVYNMLIAAGHSAIKAAEIILDAHRGQKAALTWIRIIRGMRHA